MNKFMYSLKQSLKQMHRNKGMSFTSIFAITAMMIILGVFLAIIVNINMITEMIKGDYNNIEVFFKDTVAEDQVRAKQTEVEKWDKVDTATFRSKGEALNILKRRWGDNAYLLDGLAENPLPNSIVITVKNIEDADAIATKAESIEGAEDVNYYKDTIDKLVKFTNGFQIAAIVVMAFLIIISTVVVSNTIKLTVFNRADEIMIMKHVGATNWFIRAPFLLEGIIIGIISAILSSIIVTLIYAGASEFLEQELLSVLSAPLMPVTLIMKNIIIIFVSLGIGIGAAGSIISMRRFLDTE